MTAATPALASGGDAELAFSLRDDMESLAAAQDRLRQWLARHPIGPGPRNRVEVVFEELVANVVMHAHPGGRRGDHAIGVSLRFRPEAVELVVEDDGAAFDPRGDAGPPLSGALEDAKIGGLGLLLVRKMAARLDHVRTAEGRNRTTATIALA